jgi:hypothetical protein
VFGAKTERATREFQRRQKLTPDGVVGNRTYAKAAVLGLPIAAPDKDADWPARPKDLRPLNQRERRMVFGHFRFKGAPTKKNPERIEVLGDWRRQNIVRVDLGVRTLWMHRRVADPMRELYGAWKQQRLHKRILTWNGSYVARFVRGSRTTLSNHAWGTAIDLNRVHNRLGHLPALVGEKGSLRELVEIANEQGWWWGGHYRGRLDGMHFEATAKVL